jgi:benzylsuccinate CoA-transferase BbsF subunit
MQKKPLGGIKVADFGWVFTVPLITKTMGDLGAEVIKIEGTTRGDGERRRHPYKDHEPGLNRATDFNYNNTSKLSVAVNLTHKKGIEVAKRLVAWADIVVENFAAGAMEKLGLGYEELRKIKPDIIMLSASMQGQTGPHARHPGYGHHLTALAGFHHLVGWPDRPSQHFGPYTDWVSPQFGLVALLSALDYRRRTGKGQYFDLSQYEVGEHFLAPLLLDYTLNGRIATRVGNRDAYAAPHGAYRCRGEDRWCAIGVFTDEEWKCFCRVIGNPQWTKEARFASLAERKRNEDELDRLVEAWTVNYPPEEVMNLMQAAGVPAGLVETEEDMMEHDPQFRHANFFRTLDHAEVGKYRSPRPPFVLSKAACEVRCAPLIGEHNAYVCKEILAMDDEEIAELVTEGVIE